MPAPDRILVIKSYGTSCSNFSCDQIIPVLSHSFPSAKIQLGSGSKEGTSADPALIVVQSRCAEDLVCSTEHLPAGMRSTPVLAVMCGMHQPDEMPLEVLRSLDDYICCPFRPFQFLLRVRRLLPSPADLDGVHH